jgi:alpha-ribazole phosphatase/probable phosphoglycerate mutase
MTLHSKEEFESTKNNYITKPYPSGESYRDVADRTKEFLNEISESYDNKRVMIVGHNATYYALEHIVNGVPLEELVNKKFEWQPEWQFKMQTPFVAK